MPRTRLTARNSRDFGKLVYCGPISRCDELGCQPVVWTPNRRSLRHVPRDFELRFNIYISDSDGLRRFIPQPSLREFLVSAACGGLAIRHRTTEMSVVDRQSLRLQILLFQWSFSDRRLAKRHWKREEDLTLCLSERPGESERDVLPDISIDCGQENDRRVRLNELLTYGESLGEATGMPMGSLQARLDAGLLALAYDGDTFSELTTKNALSVVRFALTGCETMEGRVDLDTCQRLEERLIAAVHKHLDASNDAFRQWLWEDVDNIIQQISRRTQGGTIDLETVRLVMNDLLWRSYGTVSDLVRLQMQAVRLALQPSMTRNERRVFGFRYERQPWLGDLAPVLLHHQPTLLLPTLARLEEDGAHPDRIWRSFLQALVWSREMTLKRREADRTQKKGVAVRLAENRVLEQADAKRQLRQHWTRIRDEKFHDENDCTEASLIGP